VEKVISACQARVNPDQEDDPAWEAITYFQSNRHRMRYSEFRAQDYQIGSGTIESGCKRVIGARLKQAGMTWTFNNANRYAVPTVAPHDNSLVRPYTNAHLTRHLLEPIIPR